MKARSLATYISISLLILLVSCNNQPATQQEAAEQFVLNVAQNKQDAAYKLLHDDLKSNLDKTTFEEMTGLSRTLSLKWGTAISVIKEEPLVHKQLGKVDYKEYKFREDDNEVPAVFLKFLFPEEKTEILRFEYIFTRPEERAQIPFLFTQKVEDEIRVSEFDEWRVADSTYKLNGTSLRREGAKFVYTLKVVYDFPDNFPDSLGRKIAKPVLFHAAETGELDRARKLAKENGAVMEEQYANVVFIRIMTNKFVIFRLQIA